MIEKLPALEYRWIPLYRSSRASIIKAVPRRFFRPHSLGLSFSAQKNGRNGVLRGSLNQGDEESVRMKYSGQQAQVAFGR
jgi:hypothetical protein